MSPEPVEAFQCGDCEAIFEEPGEAVYECSRCNSTQVGERRCTQCNIFMAKIGDESCPDCESGEDINPVTVFPAADGTFHFTADEAVTWDDTAEERAAEEAERVERHRAMLDAHISEREEENRARSAMLLPALHAVADGLDPVLCPDLLDGVRLNIESMERHPEDGGRYGIGVSLGELALALLGPDVAADAAFIDDNDNGWDERGVVCARLRGQIIPFLTDEELVERVNDPWFTGGSVLVVDPENVVGLLDLKP